MEIQKAKLIVGEAGGTAGKGSLTYKLSLPSRWIKALGLGAQERRLELCFDGEQIIIRKPRSISEFTDKKRSIGHELMLLRYYDRDMLCTTVCADFTDRTLCVENSTEQLIKTAFGKNNYPTWQEFKAFLEERCVPRSRAGLQNYLESLGLDEYEPLEIIKKTSGRMAEDAQWIELEALT